MRTLIRMIFMTIFVLTNMHPLHAQWILQNSGTNARLSDVVMLDTVTAIAVGQNGSILQTTNSGTTWLDVSAPVSYGGLWSAVTFTDSINGVIVGDSGAVSTTHDGGESWLTRNIPGGPKCLSALCTGPGSFTIGTDSGWVYNTSDTGKTWTSEKISQWPIRSLFTWRDTIPITGVSKYALTPYSICTQFMVPSLSWGESILASFQGLGSEAFDAEFCRGGGTKFIVGVHGDLRAAPAIQRKLITDTAWREVSTGIVRDGSFLSVSAPSADVIYVSGSNGMIYKSTNGGDAWLDQTVQTTRNVNAIFFYDGERGFAVGDSGMILHTTNGGPTDVRNRGDLPPAKFALEQNFPNPFNPSTMISFTLPSRSFVSLKVFNLLGDEVTTIVSELLPAGYYSRQWNAARIPSGVYFYRIKAGNYLETKKLVLLR